MSQLRRLRTSMTTLLIIGTCRGLGTYLRVPPSNPEYPRRITSSGNYPAAATDIVIISDASVMETTAQRRVHSAPGPLCRYT